MTASVLLLTAAFPWTATTMADGDGALDWSNDHGPAGGPVGAIAGNPDVLVAGTWQLGGYTSTDNGVSWDEAEDFPPITEAWNAAFSPHDENLGFVSGYGGLARTTDAGQSWEHHLDVGFTGPIAFHPESDLIAIDYRPEGTFDHHVWVSEDGGDTWDDLGAVPDTGLWLTGIAFGPTKDHVYAMMNFRSWVTTDGGGTWTEFSDGGRALAQEDDGTIWRAGFGPLKKSTDHGVTWQEVSVPTNNPSLVAAGPAGVFAATNDGILLSTDDGDSWTNLGFAEAMFGLTDLFVDPRDPDAVFLTDENLGVVWVGPTPSGYALQGRTGGFPPVPVNALGASADGSLLLAGGSHGTYGSSDGGDTWSHLGAGMGMGSTRAVAANVDGSVVYAGGQTLFFWPWLASSHDGGLTWDFTGIEIGGDGYVSGLATHPEDPLTAWVAVWGELTESHVFETTDGGETWDAILVTNDKVHDVAYHAASDSVLVATSNGVQIAGGFPAPGTPVSLGVGAAWSVATRGGHAWAAMDTTNLYRNPVDVLPVLAPWAPAEDSGRHVALDGQGGAWLTLRSGALAHCVSADDVLGLAGACGDATPPGGGIEASMVRPDDQRVFAASPDAGLWSAQL